MGFLQDTLKKITGKARDELAEQILEELREECPKITGKTAASFHIMSGGTTGGTGISVSRGGTADKGGIGSVFVGSTEITAKWSDEGNGGENKIITAKHRRKSGAMGALGQYPDGIPGIGWKQYVHGYGEGTRQNGHRGGFVKRVADRHR